MKKRNSDLYFGYPLSLQEEFAPYRGSATGVVATEGEQREVESLPLASLGDLRRGRMGK